MTFFYSPWEDDNLVEYFETHIVPKLHHADWVQELKEDGWSDEEIEDEIWKEFPNWAVEHKD